MVMVTVVPLSTVLSSGETSMTLPSSSWLVVALVTILTVRPACRRASLASSSFIPLTPGTVTRPEATTRETLEPRWTEVPETGSVRMTSPFLTPGESSEVTSPTTSPALVRMERASAWDLPDTSGTSTMAEPEEKWTVTVLPTTRLVPAPGSLETARPESMVSLATSEPLA